MGVLEAILLTIITVLLGGGITLLGFLAKGWLNSFKTNLDKHFSEEKNRSKELEQKIESISKLQQLTSTQVNTISFEVKEIISSHKNVVNRQIQFELEFLSIKQEFGVIKEQVKLLTYRNEARNNSRNNK